jgi:endonuclease III
VVDAHVVRLARRLRAAVVTSDPDDIAALDRTLTVVTV